MYATQDNVNQNPLNNWALAMSSWSRVDGIVELQLGSSISPPLTRGSYIEVTGAAELNFTGCAYDGSANTVRYFNPGPDSSGSGTGGIRSNLNPAWTSGFMWAPSYQTNIDSAQSVVEAKFGDGYSQRQRDGINNNMDTFSLSFENRSDREARAIVNYIQDKGGADPIKISTVSLLNGNPDLYYTVKNPKIAPSSFNLNNITATATQCFDPI